MLQEHVTSPPMDGCTLGGRVEAVMPGVRTRQRLLRQGNAERRGIIHRHVMCHLAGPDPDGTRDAACRDRCPYGIQELVQRAAERLKLHLQARVRVKPLRERTDEVVIAIQGGWREVTERQHPTEEAEAVDPEVACIRQGQPIATLRQGQLALDLQAGVGDEIHLGFEQLVPRQGGTPLDNSSGNQCLHEILRCDVAQCQVQAVLDTIEQHGDGKVGHLARRQLEEGICSPADVP